jgi:internalin A
MRIILLYKIELISQMSTLKDLNLNQCRIRDDTLVKIGLMTNLITLNLGDNRDITNDGLKNLSTLTSLVNLNLSHTKITSVAELSPLTNLTSLYLQGCKKIEWNNTFTSFKSLTYLDIGSLLLNEAALLDIATLKHLNSLHVSIYEESKVNMSQVIDFLVSKISLTSLNLHGGVNDSQMKKLSTLPHLVNLTLTGNNTFTDTGIRSLCKLTELTTLYIVGSKITQIGMKYLLDLKYLTKVSIKDCEIGCRGFSILCHSPVLKSLFISSCDVTQKDVAKLRAHFPEIDIELFDWDRKKTISEDFDYVHRVHSDGEDTEESDGDSSDTD